ncbi:RsmB/NOP family class I SAM-dependent RNA methyltransferase [Clostridium isatidis]|uniref:NOL1/NOP2/sun family RNA methylase n=1 Tax=Clostridium isatidis TaxID=182773 RepID=A0A343JAM1_9CLOT|nr:RsmB/NOP family class I SAM-dependent RNA methyltransferase [Clostridium isatidis]ASW42579.1 NOL1/NOP2/sun family RNA methylase [Clostridium isatidis]NLZ34982.1 RsmB/NOP family class I SAM-dependent RNA methyltransferase [Clostridiales bacterium]
MSIKEIKNNLPEEFIEILEEIYSNGQLDKIYSSFTNGRYTSFRVNRLKGNVSEVVNELNNKKIKAVNCSFIKNAFIAKGVKERTLRKLEIYKQGKIYVQNISSMLPPLFLELKENTTILDMCAAPGGKSLFIADLINNKATILANDINEVRRKRLEYNIEKQGASSVIVLGTDGRTIGKRLKNYFDRILLDVPCSGEGIITLKKNKKYLSWNMKKILSFAKMQKKLLDSAYNALKPGGIIVYSTCTLNPFENENIIEYALDKYKDLKLDKIDLELKNTRRGLTRYKEKIYNKEVEKAIRIIPNEYMEGFFVAKLVKRNQ